MRAGISARQKSLGKLTELLHCEDFNGGRAELRRSVLVIEYTP
jgi:hypothetical protein